MKFELRCKDDDNGGDDREDPVQLDVGDDVVASLTESGVISVWDKETGELAYQERHHGAVSVFAVKVARGAVLTGAKDGSLVKLELCEEVEGWRVTQRLETDLPEISHIDSDGRIAVVSTSTCLRVWDLEEGVVLEEGDPVAVEAWMFWMCHPFVVIVGGENWPGIQVWNIVERSRIRDIDIDGKKFHNVHSNGAFVAISEIKELWCGDAGEDCLIFVFSIEELLDRNISDDKLWRKGAICRQLFSEGEVKGAVNTTSLVISQGKTFSKQDFWNCTRISIDIISKIE